MIFNFTFYLVFKSTKILKLIFHIYISLIFHKNELWKFRSFFNTLKFKFFEITFYVSFCFSQFSNLSKISSIKFSELIFLNYQKTFYIASYNSLFLSYFDYACALKPRFPEDWSTYCWIRTRFYVHSSVAIFWYIVTLHAAYLSLKFLPIKSSNKLLKLFFYFNKTFNNDFFFILKNIWII